MNTKQVIAAGGLALSLVAGIGLGASIAEAAAPTGAIARTQTTVAGTAGVEQANYYHRPYHGGRYYGRPYYGRPYHGGPYYGRPYWGPPVVYRPYRPLPYYYYAPVPYYAPPAYYYPY